MKELSKEPVRDRAEHNAYFPSEYSLSVYTSPKTDFDGFKFKKAYEGGKYKVLMVASDERYVQMKMENFSQLVITLLKHCYLCYIYIMQVLK